MGPPAGHTSTIGAVWGGWRALLGEVGEGLREAEGCMVKGVGRDGGVSLPSGA